MAFWALARRCARVDCLTMAPWTLAQRRARIDRLTTAGFCKVLDPQPTFSWLSAGPSMRGISRSFCGTFGPLTSRRSPAEQVHVSSSCLGPLSPSSHGSMLGLACLGRSVPGGVFGTMALWREPTETGAYFLESFTQSLGPLSPPSHGSMLGLVCVGPVSPWRPV
jgi:hypothetical protein